MANKNGNESKTLTWIQRLYPLGFREDAVTLVKIIIPLGISYILSMATITAVSVAFMGHLGQAELNASSLAYSIYLLISYALILGLNFGCDTLLPQYFGGNKRMMGIIWQRGILISVYAWFISWIFMLNAKHILRLIVSDPHVTELTNIYLRDFLLMVPLDALSLSLRMYIGTTKRIIPILIINVIANLINILLHYIFIYQLHFGIRAAPISITITNALIVIGYILYIRFSSLYIDTWHPITRACLQEWKIYLKYAIPGVFVILVEYLSIETGTLFAAHINNQSLSAQSVVQQVVSIAYLISQSVSDSSNILIGQKIGMNKPMEAINAKNVAYTVASFFIIFDFIIIIVFHPWLPYIFSVEATAVSLTRYALLVSALSTVLDGYIVVQAGIAKGCEMQKYVAIIWIIGFDVIGLPLAYVLTFIAHLNIYGFWIGMITAEVVTSIVLFIVLWRFDWYAFTKEVAERININQPSKLLENEFSLNNTPTSNLNDFESLPLLPYKSDEKTNAIVDAQDRLSLRLDEQPNKSSEIKVDKSLFKLLGVKIIVLIPFICLFVVSIIMNNK